MHKCISYLNRQQQQQQHGNTVRTNNNKTLTTFLQRQAGTLTERYIRQHYPHCSHLYLSLSVPALTAPLAAAEQCLLTVTSPRAICQVAPFALKVVRHDAAHAFYRSPLDSIARNRNRNRNSHNQSRQLVCSSAEHKRAQYCMPNSQTKY